MKNMLRLSIVSLLYSVYSICMDPAIDQSLMSLKRGLRQLHQELVPAGNLPPTMRVIPTMAEEVEEEEPTFIEKDERGGVRHLSRHKFGKLRRAHRSTHRRTTLFKCKRGKCRKVEQYIAGSQEHSKHDQIRRAFFELQKKYGICVARPQQTRLPIAERRAWGKNPNRKQIIALRSELNELLKKDTLMGSEITLIKNKINQLRQLNPRRWPKPEDYEEVLTAREL